MRHKPDRNRWNGYHNHTYGQIKILKTMKNTSKQAYDIIKPKIGIIQSKVFNALKSIDKGSFRDISNASNLTESQVWKRLSELRDSGKIIEDSIKKCEISGRSVTVWAINQK